MGLGRHRGIPRFEGYRLAGSFKGGEALNDSTALQRKKRTRRSTEEVVDKLIEAAVEEFQEKGYGGATTAAIARRAHVSEALLFTHFKSKAQLFKDTIFRPLSQHFEKWLSDHPIAPEDPNSRRTLGLEYIAELQDFIASHSRMFLSLVFTECYRTGEVDGLGEIKGLHDYFARSAALASANLGDSPVAIDPEIMARLSFVSIMSCILFQDWIFPSELADRATIRDALGRFVMDGINANGRSDDLPRARGEDSQAR
jgi:AcrR family transcriptional regulator